jgi:hypothetical protein
MPILMHGSIMSLKSTDTSSIISLLFTGALFTSLPHLALATDVPCNFMAVETTEIHILANGKTLWTGSIEKPHTKTVAIPDGPFTVISKVYNPNLKMNEDVRTDMHTRQCRENATLAVPLFQAPTER